MSVEWIAVVIVFFTVATVRWLGSRESKVVKAILNWFPAILFAYVIPAAFTHAFDLDLKQVTLHGLSKEWIIPFTILLVMTALPFRQLKIVGIRPIVVFVFGSLVIAVLPVLLVLVFGTIDSSNSSLFLDQSYWKGLVPIVGGWIGGSTSQLVLKEVIGTDEGLFLSILVLDNVLVNIWTILMFQLIKRSNKLNSFFNIKSRIDLIEDSLDANDKVLNPWQTLGIILSITAVVNLIITSFLAKVIVLSIGGLILGNVLRRWNAKFVLKLGGVAIVVIMAILGLKLDFSNFALPAVLVVLVVIWLILHYIFMMGAAVLLKLNLAWVPIASMANLGGISTAPAVTSAYRKELMPHAILLAILSMVTGTMWGLVTIYLFELLI